MEVYDLEDSLSTLQELPERTETPSPSPSRSNDNHSSNMENSDSGNRQESAKKPRASPIRTISEQVDSRAKTEGDEGAGGMVEEEEMEATRGGKTFRSNSPSLSDKS